MQLGERNWTEIEGLTDRVVVCPIGALEQHGHHLPLLTDAMIGGEIARRVEAATEDCALFTPMLWMGASHHHLSFPGTISLSQATYRAVIEDMAESLIAAGFRKLFFLNSHAGNIVPAQAALLEVQLRHRKTLPDLFVCVGSWFEIALPELAALGLVQKKVIHACEWETSVIQVTHPELVKDTRPAARRDIGSEFWSPDHIITIVWPYFGQWSKAAKQEPLASPTKRRHRKASVYSRPQPMSSSALSKSFQAGLTSFRGNSKKYFHHFVRFALSHPFYKRIQNKRWETKC